MRKNSDSSFTYSLTKWYVTNTFEDFYDQFVVLGAENIPQDGNAIFAPNHLNALMDALVVIDICPKHYSVSFLARSDIFSKPWVAKFLQFAKIMPAYRSRDGFEQLGKNQAVFEQCVALLKAGNALCIMPEGNQGEKQQLRQLAKGIFRIAFATQQALPEGENLKILPIGIDYGSIQKFGKHLIVNIGKPIDVADYMLQYDENNVLAINALRKTLSNEMSNLMLNIASEHNYQLFGTLLDASNSIVENRNTATATDKFNARKMLNNELHYLAASGHNFEAMAAIGIEYNTLLQKLKLRSQNIPFQQINNGQLLRLILTLPIFLWSLAFHFLPFVLPVYVRKAMGVKFEGFFASIQYVIGLITFPLFYLLQTALLFSLLNISWLWAPIFWAAQYFIGKWSYKWYAKMLAMRAKMRANRLRKEQNSDFKRLEHLHSSIINFIQSLHLPVFGKSVQ